MTTVQEPSAPEAASTPDIHTTAGKLADFVVLSGDYMTIPVEEVEALYALATYVDGKEVFRHQDAAY